MGPSRPSGPGTSSSGGREASIADYRTEKDVWTQSSGTTTVTRFGYDGVEVWADLNGSNALQTHYMHGDAVDDIFARIGSGGTVAWYLVDHLGSVRDIVTNSGAVIDHVDYDPFGNWTNETSASNGDRYRRHFNRIAPVTTVRISVAGRLKIRLATAQAIPICIDM